MSKKLSCGLLIESQGRFFLQKATGSNRWDIPKGICEEGELPLATALRECIEESGMDLSIHQSKIKNLGVQTYLPQKDLHLFYLNLPQPFDAKECHCTSMVVIPNRKPFPEVCDYQWMDWEEMLSSVGKGLNVLLQSVVKDSPKMLGPKF